MRKLGACTQEPCLSVSLYDSESKRTQQLEREKEREREAIVLELIETI
jgi:hypothetical protein